MTTTQLLQRYRDGELTEGEVCSMLAERADRLTPPAVDEFIRAEPALRETLLKWLRYVAMGREIASSEGSVRISPAARTAARSLLAAYTAAPTPVRDSR